TPFSTPALHPFPTRRSSDLIHRHAREVPIHQHEIGQHATFQCSNPFFVECGPCGITSVSLERIFNCESLIGAPALARTVVREAGDGGVDTLEWRWRRHEPVASECETCTTLLQGAEGVGLIQSF